MFKNMKVGTKIGLGFGLLILIAMALGGMAVVNMKNVAGESTKLAKEYVPEVDVAGKVRGASNRLMYAMRGYGFTENDAYYNDALKEIEAMEKGLANGRQLADTAVNLEKLSGQLDTIENAKAEYKAAMQETKDLVAALDVQRGNLDKNAAAYIENSNDFLANQNAAFERDLAERQEKIEMANELSVLGASVRVMNFKAQSLKDVEMLNTAIKKLEGVPEIVEKLRAITRDQEDILRINHTLSAANGYQQAMQAFFNEFRKGVAADLRVLDEAREKMDHNAGLYVRSCDEFLAHQQRGLTADMTERHAKITLANDVIDIGNDTRIKAFKSQALRDPALMIDAQKNFQLMDQNFDELRKITRLDADLKRIDTVQKSARGYGQAMNAFLADWKKLQALGQKRDALGGTMIAACIQLADAGMENTVAIADAAMNALNASSTIMIIGLIVALVVGIGLAFFITRGITRAITRVVEGLSEGAEQVASASSQVSGASQSLAEGASEQAASIEETSSSLEEMSSMTRQNADNANQADTLMKEANQVVTAANQSMSDLTQSMEEISKASEETSKIIKTIDEIAFQTNLLALNAAVEAARAGEAGAGFAVVADEVRNLAMRAADAAKNTADLIEGTVKQVKEGGELVAKTNGNFSEVAQSSAKVGELVAEIAAASSEQAQGISQVNTAVNEVDKVTQQNAANAEESASASEEMNAQAEQMKVFVAELVAMVGASKNGNGANGSGKKSGRSRRTLIQHKMPHLALNGGRSGGKAAAKPRVPTGAMQKTSPEDVIPLDKDFEDF